MISQQQHGGRPLLHAYNKREGAILLADREHEKRDPDLLKPALEVSRDLGRKRENLSLLPKRGKKKKWGPCL